MAKRLRTQRLRKARRLLDEAYQAYFSSINSNNNDSNNINSNSLDNDSINNDTYNSRASNNNNNDNNNNDIHPVGNSPPRSSSPESISSQLTQRIFPDTPSSSRHDSPADSTERRVLR